jgi:hypothetical protein
MDITNYYLLLELPLDPPEEDAEAIESAIKSKQSQWSRARNHPTKGTLAQQYIGMIPEIRKVMGDPELRQKEAKAARKILREKEREKYAVLDRHLAILMSKGEIADAEIGELAKRHGISEEQVRARKEKKGGFFKVGREVDRLLRSGKMNDKQIQKLAASGGLDVEKLRNWVRLKEKEKRAEIERYAARSGRRGFITTEEIALLGQLHGVPEETILKRVKCPIKQKGEPGTEAPAPLERTVEKVINDKLSIVGKSSLYDFLDVPPSADLYTVQKKSAEKETEIRRSSQKDAAATASGALAGHCIAVFKTEESRKAYDISLTRSRLGELNADIDAAGIPGRIWPQAFDILVRLAVKLGMDVDEADAYVASYCEGRGWPVDRRKVKIKKARKPLSRGATFGMIAAGVLLVVAAGYVGLQYAQEIRVRNAYEAAVAQAEAQTNLEGREVIFRNFAAAHGGTEYAQLARRRLQGVQTEIDRRDFENAVQKAEAALADGELEAARNAYAAYLDQHPRGAEAVAARQARDAVIEKIEDREFAALDALAGRPYEERMAAYESFIAAHPESRHVPEVRERIVGMLDRFQADLERDLEACEAAGDWDQCMALADAFIRRFDGTEQAEAVRGLRKGYENRDRNRADLADMRRRAAEHGDDLESARLIYLEYLEANPELPSSVKRLIVAEVTALDQEIEAQIAAEEAWEAARDFSQDDRNGLDQRIGRITAFQRRHPNLHAEEAGEILERLRTQKEIQDQQLQAQREENDWRELVNQAGNAALSFDDRIGRVNQFLGKYPNTRYRQNASRILAQLRQQRQRLADQQRAQQALLAQRRQEQQRIAGVVARSGGRLVDNGNGTLTDRQTGRTWTMFDALTDRRQCLTHPQAVQYVNGLTTGGHRDWRLPTAAELETLLGGPAAFPSPQSRWFWTSDVYWHGWNEMAQILAAAGGGWKKDSAAVDQCGSALGVRP